ncbi:MAG: FAD binding domain-containing protein [Syntrophomonas sp.]
MVRTHHPDSLKEALSIRGMEKVTVLAGGTDLMVRNRSWSGTLPVFERDVLFIGHLEELKKIREKGEFIILGASCTLAQIMHDGRVPEYVKLPLAQMASSAIRNVATIGGNICNASPAGDTLPMLYALNASLQLNSEQGSRIVTIQDFITGPGGTGLQDDEILTEIHIPTACFSHQYYKKAGLRKANAISKVSFFAVANSNHNRIDEVRIALGAVAPTPVRSREGEALLAGLEIEALPERFYDVKACYEQLLSPIDDVRSTEKYRHKAALLILEDFLLNVLRSHA